MRVSKNHGSDALRADLFYLSQIIIQEAGRIMARKDRTRLIGTPVAEGVRFELGETISLAVRNTHHDIAVHVYPQTHFFRDLFAGLPLVRGIVRLFSSIGRLFSGIKDGSILKPQTSVRGSSRTRRLAKLFQTTPQNLAELVDILLIPIQIGRASCRERV